MSSERVSVRADLRRKFQSLSGVGPATATKCADAAMEYLDSLVQNQARPSAKPGERDEDGIERVKRPKEIPEEYNYMYWGETSSACWLYHHKPIDFTGVNYTCDGINDIDEHEEKPIWLACELHISDILHDERIRECGPEDRIVRLVD